MRMTAQALITLLAAGTVHAAASAAPAGVCRAQSAAAAPQVVELYTSEGCSSCPPADAWLSTLKGRADVIALGFHVNYWDRLGWPDRFASAEFTRRQYDLAARAGSRQVYTPQVVVDGRDWRGWPRLPARATVTATASAAAPALHLQRDGEGVVARIEPVAGATSQLSGYWAVTEDRHESRVRAGENAGATLQHDHIVRLLKAVPPWNASQGLSSRLEVNAGVPEHPRRVVFVVTDARTLRPLQALALGC